MEFFGIVLRSARSAEFFASYFFLAGEMLEELLTPREKYWVKALPDFITFLMLLLYTFYTSVHVSLPGTCLQLWNPHDSTEDLKEKNVWNYDNCVNVFNFWGKKSDFHWCTSLQECREKWGNKAASQQYDVNGVGRSSTNRTDDKQGI